MPRSNVSIFQAKSGLFHLVNLKGDGGVFGPYDTEKEAREARRRLPAHEASCKAVDQYLKPQPAAERDINPLTR